jgi:hypothetical protein
MMTASLAPRPAAVAAARAFAAQNAGGARLARHLPGKCLLLVDIGSGGFGGGELFRGEDGEREIGGAEVVLQKEGEVTAEGEAEIAGTGLAAAA